MSIHNPHTGLISARRYDVIVMSMSMTGVASSQHLFFLLATFLFVDKLQDEFFMFIKILENAFSLKIIRAIKSKTSFKLDDISVKLETISLITFPCS